MLHALMVLNRTIVNVNRATMANFVKRKFHFALISIHVSIMQNVLITLVIIRVNARLAIVEKIVQRILTIVKIICVRMVALASMELMIIHVNALKNLLESFVKEHQWWL